MTLSLQVSRAGSLGGLRLQVARTWGATDQSTGVRLQVSRATGTRSSGARLQVARANSVITPTFQVDAGLGDTVNAFDYCQLSATVPTPGIIVTSITWRQVKTGLEPDITLEHVSINGTAYFSAPATQTETVYTFEARATAPGQPDAVDLIAVRVQEHPGPYAMNPDGTLVGLPFMRDLSQIVITDPGPADHLYPSPSLYPSPTLYPR